MKIELQFRVEELDGRRFLYLKSPDVPGLYLFGESLASILGEAGLVAERLIEINNMETLKPLLSRKRFSAE